MFKPNRDLNLDAWLTNEYYFLYVEKKYYTITVLYLCYYLFDFIFHNSFEWSVNSSWMLYSDAKVVILTLTRYLEKVALSYYFC